ncbi:MAG: biotin transporter BioY [Elusimicrobia bacterium]|nr:biotin transporter BioY [Elusimicrobiota bacterium]
MSVSAIEDIYLKERRRFFVWSRKRTFSKGIFLAFSMAVFTAVSARFCVRLPFTPVPVTGQVFGVLLSGVICGARFGALSQIIYIAAGCLGLPWFAGGISGSAAYLFGPTGGYLIGFVLAAYIVGRFADGNASYRKFLPQVGVMIVAVFVIYLIGAFFLAVAMNYGFSDAVIKGVFPFILLDLAKALLAGLAGGAILPKR